MRRSIRLALVAALSSIATFTSFAGLALPPGDINLEVKPGTVSFFNITLSGVPSGYSVGNKTYTAWCVDRYNDFDPSLNGGLHTGYLLDVSGGGLPPLYADVPWDKIHYILNHKAGTIDDVQHAIWWFTDGVVPDPLVAPMANAMIAAADANGAGFVPGVTQIRAALAVWTSPNPAAQGVIIEVPGAPDVGSGDDDDGDGNGNGGGNGNGNGNGGGTCSDRFTTGGFTYRDGSKVTFGIQGGVKNGSLHGGINLVDHGLGMHVRGRTITRYTAIDANCREADYEVTINGVAGTATVRVCDYGEPGSGDVVEVTLSDGYMMGQGSTLGGTGSGGGNVQLHTGSCNQPPQAKPNPGGKKPKKPGVGNGNGNSNGNGNGNGDVGGGNGNNGKNPGDVGGGNGKGNGKDPGNSGGKGNGKGKGKKARS